MPRETLDQRRGRARKIIARLRRAYPDSRISLKFEDEFQLLIAVILSAQCTDAMVNKVTPGLFRRYPNAAAMADAERKELQDLIRPTGFYRNKAKSLILASRAIEERFNGKVPSTMEELDSLPGVARKTANVVLWNAFRRTEGIAVDTHVTRVANLLRLTNTIDAKKIERDLIRMVPKSEWGQVTHLLIDHGRSVCIARRPRCEICVLNDLCPSALRPRTGTIPQEP